MNVIRQNVADQRPIVERMNKTGEALKTLLADPEADQLQEILDDTNKRFDDMKQAVRERANSLDVAFDQTSQVSIAKLTLLSKYRKHRTITLNLYFDRIKG